jgi:hypothetical protein
MIGHAMSSTCVSMCCHVAINQKPASTGSLCAALVGISSVLFLYIRKGSYVFLLSFQEWPEAVYPNYANGPGYVISSDIARYIVSEFDNQTLRVSILWTLSTPTH